MQCAICLQEPNPPEKQQCCGNIFCQGCIENWRKVKSSCPLCGFKIGQQEINTLKYQSSRNEFDDGFMMLDTEIKQIQSRINYAENRITHYRGQSKNMKTLISPSHMTFLDDQFQLLKQYQHNMQDAFASQNRITCVEFLQLIIQLLSSIEIALDSGSFKYDYGGMQEEYGEEYEDYYDPEEYEDELYMYEQYEVENSRKQFNKNKKNSKVAGSNQQKNKTVL